MAKNFQVTAVEDNKKYWISRHMATRSEVLVHDGDDVFILIGKRGSGTPDYQGCWNIPCGYLEFDVTSKENATKELLEETGVYVPSYMWILQHIEDDPNRSNLQNVTIVYQTHITMDTYNKYKEDGRFIAIDGGEENEVEEIELLKLTMDNVNSREWAFNHKERIIDIINRDKY